MDALRFDPQNYTLETKEYKGTKIEYRYYKDLCYAAKPVDVKYQTINIMEPVAIDGKPIDCSNAPMIFALGCAGFLSSTASSGGMFDMPDTPGGPGGMPGGPGGMPGGPGGMPGGPGGMPGGPGGMPGGPMGGPGGMPPMGGPGMPGATGITNSEEWEALAGGMNNKGMDTAGVGLNGKPMLGSKPGGMVGPGPGGPGGGEMEPPGGDRNQALAMGLVVVEVGNRGRENQFPDGTYYGKAPAAITDIKAAVRYLRHNKDVIPGNVEQIISTGGSGGGLMSTLTGSSGNCAWFQPYLEEIGAADERDDIFASYSTSPIIDHFNIDGAVEWQGGGLITDPAEKKISDGIAAEFVKYLAEAKIPGHGAYGLLTGENMGEYITKEYLIPDCNRYLAGKSEDEIAEYLSIRPWIHWDGTSADFTFEDFGLYATRMGGVPTFDDLALSMPGPLLYGTKTMAAQHFTPYVLSMLSGDPEAKPSRELTDRVNSQSPAWHIMQGHSDPAKHWWIRHGACDSCTAVAPAVLLAAAAESVGCDVNLRLVWDGGHCETDDQDDFYQWVMDITGYVPNWK